MTDGSRLHVKSGDEITNTRTGHRMVFGPRAMRRVEAS